MDLAVIWFFPFDLGKRVDIMEFGRELLKSGIAEQLLSYDDKGRPQIEPDETTHVSSMLSLMAQEDTRLYQQEYRKEQRYIRLKLRDIKVTTSNNQTLLLETYMTIHREGFAVLSFWAFKDKVTLELPDIIEIMDPFERLEIDMSSLWNNFWPFLRRYEMIDQEAIKDKISSPIYSSIEKLRDLYRYFILSLLYKECESPDQIDERLRYPLSGINTVVVLFDIDEDLDSFIQTHIKELHGILAMEKYWRDVREPWIKEAFETNMAWREGWSVYIGFGRALLLLSKSFCERMKETLRRESLKEFGFPTILEDLPPFILGIDLHGPVTIILDREQFERMVEERWNIQKRAITLDLTTIFENLLLQGITLRTYDYLLSRELPESIKELSELKEFVLNSLTEFANVRVWIPLTATKWIDYGKKVMRINELYDTIREKLGILETKIQDMYNLRYNNLILFVTLALGIMQILIQIMEEFVPTEMILLTLGIWFVTIDLIILLWKRIV